MNAKGWSEFLTALIGACNEQTHLPRPERNESWLSYLKSDEKGKTFLIVFFAIDITLEHDKLPVIEKLNAYHIMCSMGSSVWPKFLQGHWKLHKDVNRNLKHPEYTFIDGNMKSVYEKDHQEWSFRGWNQ